MGRKAQLKPWAKNLCQRVFKKVTLVMAGRDAGRYHHAVAAPRRTRGVRHVRMYENAMVSAVSLMINPVVPELGQMILATVVEPPTLPATVQHIGKPGLLDRLGYAAVHSFADS
jgi:hypothetical protein